jgi:hypothetical protein
MFVQYSNSLAVFTPLLYLICSARSFAADNRLSLAVNNCEEEKKKGREKA